MAKSSAARKTEEREWRPGLRILTHGDVENWRLYMQTRFKNNVNRAAKLRKARMLAGVTQIEVARWIIVGRVGPKRGKLKRKRKGGAISNQGYGNWESGKRVLTGADLDLALKAIAKAAKAKQ